MMKLLFVSEYFPPKIMGGGEINLFLLAKNLSKKGIKVAVLTSFFKGLKRYEEIEGIKVYRRIKTGKSADTLFGNFIRSFVFPSSTRKELKKIIDELSPDIIHFIGTSIIASGVCKKKNKICVATIESYPTLCPKGDLLYKGETVCDYSCKFNQFVSCFLDSDEVGKLKNRFYIRYNPKLWFYIYHYYKKLNSSLKNCNLIAISGFIKKKLKQNGLESEIIPNMIEIGKFYRKNAKNKKATILYLGSLTRYKGPQLLLEAVKGLDCKVELYGEGNQKEELLKFIKDNKIDAAIHENVGYEKVPAIYAKSDIVVFPSLWPEPFGRIPIEAMAAGKPVIASDIGAIPEIVKNNGLLFHSGNVAELRKQIIRLINNKAFRETLGKNGEGEVKNYSTDNVTKKLIAFYKKIK